jgi:hypothetical protein
MSNPMHPVLKKMCVLLCLLGLMFNTQTVLAKLTQTIDRTDIRTGETFTLDIQIDHDEDATPDLSMIPTDVTIVSNSQYQHTQIINGRRSSIKGWKLKLKTLKEGKLVIPAISVGSESTQPIELNIKTSSYKVDLNGQEDAIFLQAEVDTTSPYVQQQMIYTISLYRAVATHYENLSTPVVKDSIIEKLGDDIVFEKMLNNRRYNVYQRKYIIFPQKSGALEIGPVNFTADVNDNRKRSRGVFLNSTRPISVTTKAIQLNVKPQPPQAAQDSTPWLPAQSVILADSWSLGSSQSSANNNATQTPMSDSQQLTVGEPVTWTLLLRVQGLSESQLPEITLPKIDGLQIYPDSPSKEREVNDKGILSKRVEKFAVIPSKAGTIKIPEIKIAWWDIDDDVAKTATLPSKTLQVIAAKASPTNTPELPSINAKPQVVVTDSDAVRQWQYLAAILLGLWLITLFAYFAKPRAIATSSSRGSRSHHDNKDRELSSQSYNQALQSAKKAIKTGQASAIESALLTLANHLTDDNYHSLGALALKLEQLNPTNQTDTKNNHSVQIIIEKLNQIEASRYSASQQSFEITFSQHDLDQLIACFNHSPKNASSSSIPPLYPR